MPRLHSGKNIFFGQASLAAQYIRLKRNEFLKSFFDYMAGSILIMLGGLMTVRVFY